MNLLVKALILGICTSLISCAPDEAHKRSKRQIGGTLGTGGKSIGGGFGHGFGAYDYNDYYGDYIGDYNYDYDDWVCTTNPPNCRLCNILGSECCDPAVDVNCFLADTCLNNPCLSGGTCVTTKTIDDRPDFTCMCLPGLSGKYCQLPTDYFVGAQFFQPPPMPPIFPFPQPVQVPYGQPAPIPYGQPGPAQFGQSGPAQFGQPGSAQFGQSGPAQFGQQTPVPFGSTGQGNNQMIQQPSPGGVLPYQRPGVPVNMGLGRMPLTG